MSLNDQVDLTSKYIKSVTYFLHPTFKPSEITVSEAPFLLSRVGWGYFEIEMLVEFQPHTGVKTMRLNHELCFENKGHTQSILLEISNDETANDEQIARELAA